MTVRCTLSVLASSISLALVAAYGQQLPEGAGKTETERVCSKCHELARSTSLRQNREGWEVTIDKMVSFGAEITDKDYEAVLDYLSKNFASEALPKLNANKAEAIEFESRLSLPRSQAAAIIEYRTKNGPFKTIEDLKKVPGVDAAKIDAKKDKITF
jgi:competence protein ComEA